MTYFDRCLNFHLIYNTHICVKTVKKHNAREIGETGQSAMSIQVTISSGLKVLKYMFCPFYFVLRILQLVQIFTDLYHFWWYK